MLASSNDLPLIIAKIIEIKYLKKMNVVNDEDSLFSEISTSYTQMRQDEFRSGIVNNQEEKNALLNKDIVSFANVISSLSEEETSKLICDILIRDDIFMENQQEYKSLIERSIYKEVYKKMQKNTI